MISSKANLTRPIVSSLGSSNDHSPKGVVHSNGNYSHDCQVTYYITRLVIYIYVQ